MRIMILSILLICLPVPFLTAQDQFSLNGQVLDGNDQNIPGVRITVYRESGVVARTSADATGSYSITYKSGEPVSILYDHSGWTSAKVVALSGKRDNKVNKTLYPLGSSLSKLQKAEAISALETQFILTPSESRKDFLISNKNSFQILGISETQFQQSVAIKVQDFDRMSSSVPANKDTSGKLDLSTMSEKDLQNLRQAIDNAMKERKEQP